MDAKELVKLCDAADWICVEDACYEDDDVCPHEAARRQLRDDDELGFSSSARARQYAALLEVLDELIESVLDVHDGDFGPLERARAVRDAEVKHDG